MLLEEFIITFGYLGVSLLVLGLNAVPFFIPPDVDSAFNVESA
jgi:hypothetical protein